MMNRALLNDFCWKFSLCFSLQNFLCSCVVQMTLALWAKVKACSQEVRLIRGASAGGWSFPVQRNVKTRATQTRVSAHFRSNLK